MAVQAAMVVLGLARVGIQSAHSTVQECITDPILPVWVIQVLTYVGFVFQQFFTGNVLFPSTAPNSCVGEMAEGIWSSGGSYCPASLSGWLGLMAARTKTGPLNPTVKRTEQRMEREAVVKKEKQCFVGWKKRKSPLRYFHTPSPTTTTSCVLYSILVFVVVVVVHFGKGYSSDVTGDGPKKICKPDFLPKCSNCQSAVDQFVFGQSNRRQRASLNIG